MDRRGSDSSGDDVFNDNAHSALSHVMAVPPPVLLLTTTTGSLFKTPPTILKTSQGTATSGRRFSYWRKLYANQVSVIHSSRDFFLRGW